jgi:hypothetical protein
MGRYVTDWRNQRVDPAPAPTRRTISLAEARAF